MKGAGQGLIDHWRLSTEAERTHDEYAVLLRNFLDTIGYDMDAEVTGVAICSGVPRVLDESAPDGDAATSTSGPIVIEPGVKTGMPILYDNPKEVGADRIANAVAAFDLYGGPTVVVDFGTGTNFDIISAKGEFVGGAIAPGIEIAWTRCSDAPPRCARSSSSNPATSSARAQSSRIQSGAVYGFVALVDGMVERFRKELGAMHGGEHGRAGTLARPGVRHHPAHGALLHAARAATRSTRRTSMRRHGAFRTDSRPTARRVATDRRPTSTRRRIDDGWRNRRHASRSPAA